MSATKALARIAWRDALRAQGRSALIVAMIALPVALATGAAAVLRTTTPTTEERVAWEMGTADLRLGHEAGEMGWATPLPEGSRILTFAEGAAEVVIRGEYGWATVSEMPFDEPLAAGRYVLISGSAPEEAGEAAVSPALLEAARVPVGGILELEGLPRLKVTGEAVRASFLKEPLVVAAEGSFPELTERVSLVALPPGASQLEVAELLMGGDGALTPGDETTWDTGAGAYSVAYAESYSGFYDQGPFGAILLFGGLMLFQAAIVAGAAFAVGARRQARSFGLLGAAGGEAHHVRRLVSLGGVLLGGVGVTLGVSLGIGCAAVAAPWLGYLVGHYTGMLTVVWTDVAVIAALGMVSALAAAFIPARAASSVSTLEALGGRRPVPRRTNVRWARAGIAVAAVGAATVVVGSLGSASVPLILAGTIAVVSGLAACAPLLVTSAARIAPAAPPTIRIALRDIGRNAHRAGPSVAAVMSALTLAVALATFITTSDADAAAKYQAWMAEDQIVVEAFGSAELDTEASVRKTVEILRERLDVEVAVLLVSAFDADSARSVAPAMDDEATTTGPGSPADPLSREVVIGGRDTVDALGGKPGVVLDERTPAVYGAGIWSDSGTINLRVIDADGSETVREAEFVDAGIPARSSTPSLVMTPALAEELGIVGPQNRWLLRTAAPLTREDKDEASRVSEEVGAGVHVAYERGYESRGLAIRLAALAASAVTALGVLAVSVGLAAAESRAEWATMSAVGMAPRARRTLAALQALLLAGFGSALALPGGLIPALAIAIGREYPIVLPWETLAAVAFGVPALAALGAWLLTRAPRSLVAHGV